MSDSFSFFEQGIERVASRMEGMPVQHVVLNRLFYFVFQQVQDSYNTFLAQYGLNGNTFLVLAMIFSSTDNKLNPCELSDVLIASRANVTRFADELVQAGWVERQVSAEDRRRVDLSLTPAGQTLVESILPVVWQRLVQQWGVLEAAEMSEFNRLLRKLLHGLNEMGAA